LTSWHPACEPERIEFCRLLTSVNSGFGVIAGSKLPVHSSSVGYGARRYDGGYVAPASYFRVPVSCRSSCEVAGAALTMIRFPMVNCFSWMLQCPQNGFNIEQSGGFKIWARRWCEWGMIGHRPSACVRSQMLTSATQ
jgi:hypothetical protein